MYRDMGRFDKASETNDAARRLFIELKATHTVYYSWVETNEGLLHKASGDYSNALACFQRALVLRKKLLPMDNPEIAFVLVGSTSVTLP